MSQKPALWLSIGLTVFVLFFLSNVFQALAGNPTDQAASAQSAGISPEIQALIAQRESAYNDMITQANAQLTQAQEALAAGQTANGSPNADLPAGVTITPEEAAAIATPLALAGSQLTGQPELVDFEGAVAYEVVFDTGNMYIDAATGEVLYNGTINLVPAPISPEQAAQIAASYLGQTDVSRVEATELGGVTVFRVKFTSGDAVFVDAYGNILLVRLASHGGNSSTASSGGEREHEDHDD